MDIREEVKKAILSQLDDVVTKDRLCDVIEQVIEKYEVPIRVSATVTSGKLEIKVSVGS